MEQPDNKSNKIPPIIEQYIRNCFDPNLARHVRDNYRDILENVVEVCEAAIHKYTKKTLSNTNNHWKKK